jgi:hypothetical protein
MSMAGEERRKSVRRKILDSFGMFCTGPRKGGYKLTIHDMSEGGLAFDLDVEGEDFEFFPVSLGESIDIRLYVNQSVFIPLRVKMVRVTEGSVRRVGGEIIPAGETKGYQAYCALLKFVDLL